MVRICHQTAYTMRHADSSSSESGLVQQGDSPEQAGSRDFRNRRRVDDSLRCQGMIARSAAIYHRLKPFSLAIARFS